MQTPFIEPGETNNAQLFFITFIYAYVLYQASDLISGGSELLMLVPAVAGLVGSIVLPILGAVPDGMMVLFSGIGPNAQETVAVGVGALAGSTVMLLTFPWFICIVFGRVPLKDGKADYANKGKAPLMGSGITFGPSIKTSAKIMLGTTLLYLVMQIPASLLEFRGDDTKEQARGEHTAALVGLVCCVLAFCGYLVYCYFDANEDKQLAAVVEGIEKKQISIAAALQFIQKTSGSQHELLSKDRGRLKKVCKPFFKRYDFDKDATLTKDELKPLLHDLGYWPDSNNMGKIMGATNGGYAASRLNASMDKDGDGKINFDEFVDYLYNFMCDDTKMALAPSFHNPKYIKYDEEDEDEEEDMPQDLAHLTPKQQMRRVIMRSLWMMGLGTVLVLIFSDPMVDCLSEWGTRLGVSPFYVSFILAPFASNASELLAAYTYACKKTEKNMTTSLSTLIGAACMNNTFVLGIFFALIYLQGLAWQFTAETFSMILIQWVIGLLAIKSNTQTVFTGVLILLCYPGCLVVVWFLENKVGWD
eukprot:CAMPEP_0177299858 /NCGR_PEP_ID=MMETSP0368-20130122/4250_1 /TAXON_ID=447022 ORGANISM="Scrippsiella hangoei-like, Strain SHHI-4" /NCGR_SAMPLE_ID=MMETSP0368 /ASSEMBLY_ACC=CAM_ASM_000363 /LENGTH=531 /DNA_ID=CAMNT_0018758219 /DNA_START=69 /DNA_END=1664 /DNA_ORIENTATION=-